MEKAVNVNVRAGMEKLSPDRLKAVKKQTYMEVASKKKSISDEAAVVLQAKPKQLAPAT